MKMKKYIVSIFLIVFLLQSTYGVCAGGTIYLQEPPNTTMYFDDWTYMWIICYVENTGSQTETWYVGLQDLGSWDEPVFTEFFTTVTLDPGEGRQFAGEVHVTHALNDENGRTNHWQIGVWYDPYDVDPYNPSIYRDIYAYLPNRWDLVVTTNPGQCTIKLDDRDEVHPPGNTFTWSSVWENDHTLVISKDGYETITDDFYHDDETTRSYTLQLVSNPVTCYRCYEGHLETGTYEDSCPSGWSSTILDCSEDTETPITPGFQVMFLIIALSVIFLLKRRKYENKR